MRLKPVFSGEQNQSRPGHTLTFHGILEYYSPGERHCIVHGSNALGSGPDSSIEPAPDPCVLQITSRIADSGRILASSPTPLSYFLNGKVLA